MSGSVYQSDPDRAPDSQFVPGELGHLVPGNHGRLLDPRRTPVHVTRVLPGSGFFEVEIDAFEDAGARWLVPLEEVTSYQFAAGGELADGAAVAELRRCATRHGVRVQIAADPAAGERTRARLREEYAQAAAWLTSAGAPERFDPLPLIEDAACWPAAAGWLRRYLGQRDLCGMEEQLAAGYVSNPWAGDLVLAHFTVLAELGLGTLAGRGVRDPAAFAGGWTRERRADHILARIGFTHALWARAAASVMLYRGVGCQDPATGRQRASSRRELPLVSASFSRQVAESHFGSPSVTAGALYRQPLRPGHLFMTFLETEAMSRRYREAEAVLLTGSGPFF